MSAAGKPGGSLSDGKPRDKKRNIFRRILKPDKKIESRVQQPDLPLKTSVQGQPPNPALGLQTSPEASGPTLSPIDSVPRATGGGHGVSDTNMNRCQDLCPTPSLTDRVPRTTEGDGASDTTMNRRQHPCPTPSPIDSAPRQTEVAHGNKHQGLWIQAHDMFKIREKDLLADYEEHLRSCKYGSTNLTDPLSTPESIEETVKQLVESRDGKQWRLPWLEADVKVREQLEKLVKFASWSDDIVKQALSAQPIAALAWSAVSILLPLLSNAMGQTETILKGFNYVCDLQRYWRFYEDMYLSKSGRNPRQELLDVLIQLYSQILEYQARVICHLSKASLKRTWWNAKGSYDWEGTKTEIQGKSESCKEYVDAHQKTAVQESFDREWQQIEELITIQGSMLHVLDEFKKQTERNNQGEKESELLRDLASNYEEDKNFNPKNVEGTCKWFFTDDTFRRWRNSNTSSLLWLSAGPGCGKSVLSRALIDTNRLCARKTTSTVCYFFFKAGDTSRTQGVDALRAILHQMFLNNPHHGLIKRALEAHKKFGKKLRHAFGELWRILIDCAEQKEAGEIICVLDALDECEERMEMIDNLVQFYSQSTKRQSSSSSTLKFLIVSRPYDDVDAGFKKLAEISTYMHFDADKKSPAIREEINLVIDAKVEEIAGSFRKEARDQISKRLKDEDNRTYLWLHLIFDIIKKSPSAYSKLSNIKELLEGLPLGLDGAYESILSRSQNEGQAKLLLEIVLAATAPLTLDEVNTALTIAIHEEKKKRYSSLNELNDDLWQGDFKMTVTNLCGLFVSVHDSKLFFIHQTAREFLTDSNGSCNRTPNKWKGRLNVQKAHGIISRACLSYVSLDPAISPVPDFPLSTVNTTESYIASMVKPHKFLQYGALNWAFHYASQDDSDAKNSILDARMLCQTTKQVKSWFSVYCTGEYLPETTWPDLILASYLGLGQVVDEMLRIENPDVNAHGGHYGNALQSASSKGHETVVRLLLEKGADIDAKNDDGLTALLLAALGGHEAVVRLLLDKGADIDAKFRNGLTALLLAVDEGHEAVVRLLLDKGADIDAKDRNGLTALFIVANKRLIVAGTGHEAIARLLLEKGTDINAENNSGWTALQIAAQGGNEVIVRLLLEKGADINAKNDNGWTALRIGAHGGWTALQLAAHGGNEVIVRLLLEKGADVQWKATDLIAKASAGVQESLVRQLLGMGDVEANTNTDKGWTALHRAAIRGHEDIVRLLLEKGADIEAKNDKGWTTLLLAAEEGHEDVVQLLLEMGANVKASTVEEQTALHVAAYKGRVDIAQILLKNGADVHAKTVIGNSALHDAASGEYEAVVWLLLEKGADVNMKANSGWTALHAAASAGHEADVSILIENGANVNAKTVRRQTALHEAVSGGHEAIVPLLLEKGADVKAKDEEGWTALYIAARGGHVAIMRLLLEEEIDIDIEATTDDGWTALLRAAMDGHDAVVRLLIEKGAAVEARTVDGRSALDVAAKGGHEAVVQLLLEKGAAVDAKDEDGWTALHIATERGHAATARLLLDAGADVEATNHGWTALCIAAQRGHEDVVRLLLEKGAKIDAKNNEGQAALHQAALEGHEAVVRLLLEKGADVEARDVDGRSALDVAVQEGHTAIAKLLTPPHPTP